MVDPDNSERNQNINFCPKCGEIVEEGFISDTRRIVFCPDCKEILNNIKVDEIINQDISSKVEKILNQEVISSEIEERLTKRNYETPRHESTMVIVHSYINIINTKYVIFGHIPIDRLWTEVQSLMKKWNIKIGFSEFSNVLLYLYERHNLNGILLRAHREIAGHFEIFDSDRKVYYYSIVMTEKLINELKLSKKTMKRINKVTQTTVNIINEDSNINEPNFFTIYLISAVICIVIVLIMHFYEII